MARNPVHRSTRYAVRGIAALSLLVPSLLVPSLLVARLSAQSTSTPQVSATADSVLDARTTAVASHLRCPVCQGESIQESPAELAKQMRGLVRDQLASGKTPDEVKAYFVARYGEWILLEPKASGFNLLLYALPIALVIGGGAVVYGAVRKWTSTTVKGEG
jgi:cytochrome c-type biogenesis protein CcmH